MDTQRIRELAESAERRAKEFHAQYDRQRAIRQYVSAAGLLNDFFYWSGKATAYRGVIAMIELATVVEDELDAEGSCP